MPQNAALSTKTIAPLCRTSVTESIPKVYFPNLDTLRFFAFFAVFTSHTFEHWKYPQNSVLQKLIFTLATLNGQSGPLGVKFFFVLSGFLITYLIFNEKRFYGRLDVRSFYMRRVLRIWPLYFLAIVIGFLLYPLIAPTYSEPARLLNQLLFLGNMDMLWNGNPTGIPLAVLWSVSVEEQFYLFWPLLFLALGRVNKYNYAIALSVLLAVSALFQFAHYNDRQVLYFHSLSCMGSLVIGGALAYLSLYSMAFMQWLRKLHRGTICGVYLLTGACIFSVFYAQSELIFTIYGLLISVLFGLIILEQNFCERSIFKFGRLKLFSYLGKISYGLYILHPIAIFLTDHLSISFWEKLLTALLGSVVIAHVSYNYFEKPFLRLKKKFETGTLQNTLLQQNATKHKAVELGQAVQN